jgi:hypothetical protein
MDLSTLRVLNVAKLSGRAAIEACGTVDQPAWNSADGFALETCQRRILVTTATRLARRAVAPHGGSEAEEWLAGAAAYRFLLELASGLKSAVVGECEILAQVKSAWSEREREGGALVAELRPWIQVMLADAKEVREQYLRGTGGQGYGSLLRHVLTEARAGVAEGCPVGAPPDGPVLVIGAGKLAAGVLPYLAGHAPTHHEIRIVNRTRATAEALRDHLQPRVHAPIVVVEPTLEAELAAWADASLVVLCVPLDPERDRARVSVALARGSGKPPRVAHLGILDTAGTVWSELDRAVTLDHLFALDRRQAALRTERIARARSWCDSRARLRALDRCVTVAHGWEDLAGFAVVGAA